MGQISRWLNYYCITASIMALVLGLPFVRGRTLFTRLSPGFCSKDPSLPHVLHEVDCMLVLCGTYGRGCKSHYLLLVRKTGRTPVIS
jgi:hypothetical protein